MSTAWHLLRRAIPGMESELHQLYVEYFNCEPPGSPRGCLHFLFPPAKPQIKYELLQHKINAISTDSGDFLNSKVIGDDDVANRLFIDVIYAFNRQRVEDLKLTASDSMTATWMASPSEAIKKFTGRNLFELDYNDVPFPYSSLFDHHFMVSRWNNEVQSVLEPVSSTILSDSFTDDMATIKTYAETISKLSCNHLRLKFEALRQLNDDEIFSRFQKVSWGYDMRSDWELEPADEWLGKLPRYEQRLFDFWGPLGGSRWL